MRRAVWVAGVVLAAVFGPVGATSAEAEGVVGEYVAMGDSFTAGPLIPEQRGAPVGCLRSSGNYPSLVARELRVGRLVDVSCSGARTSHMTQPQSVLFGRNRPQLDALGPGTSLVTVGIGGNDVGFSDLAVGCGVLSLRNPAGAPCAAQYGAGLEQRVTQTAPKVAAVLGEIRRRAPRARVLVVGYLRLLPPERGCWPFVPVARGDVPYLEGLHRSLNRMLAEQARAHGAGFVDVYTDGKGRDMCAPAGQRWVEGILLNSRAAPIHPNARGMQAVATRVTTAVREPTTVTR
ncbi:SGNH/GDSL hydrolase family protein [Actinomadura craniellae]|uniref:SGNH/GDSL hydrolase family protein n=1 Tax=Actinomadura craniellae TaxID=2231787 RepID=A0A365H8P0_9ACTN|nr:SGNH/GDSL hydrolase family protein [Actinomadura craniellae]RAY15326.1 SGNH/GDSL hydrolase family protein [Actinomadura craniellae]